MNMTHRFQLRSVLFLIALAAPIALSAQDTTKARPDSAKMGMMGMKGMMESHMMGSWKEMNAFHQVLAATWHPASEKSDLAPLKARAKELQTTADAWAASKAPAMPTSCGSEAVRGAATKVAAEAKALVALVDSAADDARLKAALKSVHDAFEVAGKGCAGHGEHK